ncbi:MAG: hypothetical protein ACI9XJ_000214 [Marivirga sp.]|jgi:hypothetical protein
MKSGIILSLCLVLVAACKSTKQLPTDGGRVINLSGIWNATDAAIMANKLKEALVNSSWYETLTKEGGGQTHLYIEEVAYQKLEEPFDKSLKAKISLSLSATNSILLISDDNHNGSSFKLNSRVKSDQVSSFNQPAIEYNLLFELVDEQEVVVWSAEENIKKYLKK